MIVVKVFFGTNNYIAKVFTTFFIEIIVYYLL
jgi:hypothetical protein